MAHVGPLADTASEAGITESRRSAVVAIRHVARQGWFTAAEARSLVDRIHAAPPPPG